MPTLEEREKIKNVINIGSEITGALGSTILSLLLGGNEGVIAGTIAKPIFTNSLKTIIDFANRKLSKREEIRIGATTTYTLIKIKQYLDNGYEPRTDGFFSISENTRSNAEEIFEGVLQKSKNEHEEKKIKILGNLFANIAFSNDTSIGQANHILNITETLTYRQLCLLSLTCKDSRPANITLHKTPYFRIDDNLVPEETISVLQEWLEVNKKGLIFYENSLLNWSYITPNEMALSILGKKVYKILGLQEIPEEDIIETAKHLSPIG